MPRTVHPFLEAQWQKLMTKSKPVWWKRQRKDYCNQLAKIKCFKMFKFSSTVHYFVLKFQYAF